MEDEARGIFVSFSEKGLAAYTFGHSAFMFLLTLDFFFSRYSQLCFVRIDLCAFKASFDRKESVSKKKVIKRNCECIHLLHSVVCRFTFCSLRKMREFSVQHVQCWRAAIDKRISIVKNERHWQKKCVKFAHSVFFCFSVTCF